MLQIRHKTGKVTPIDDGMFVEMVNNSTGRLGAVWYQDGNRIVHIKPGSVEAIRYENLFRGAFGPKEIEI